MASDSDTEQLLSDVDDEQVELIEPEPEVQAVKVSSRQPSLHARLNAHGNSALVGGAIALVVAGLAGYLLKRLLRPKKKTRLPPSKRVSTTPKKRQPTAAPASPAGTAAQGSKASAASSSRTTPASSPAKPASAGPKPPLASSPAKPASAGPKLPLRPALPQRPARRPARATSPAAPPAPAAVATPATPALATAAPRSTGPAAVPARPAAAPAATVASVDSAPAAATTAAPLPAAEPGPAAAPAVENGMEFRIPPPPRPAEPADAPAPEVDAPEPLPPVTAAPASQAPVPEPEGAGARPAVTSQLHADAKPFFPSFAAAEPAAAAAAMQEQRPEGEDEAAAPELEAPVGPNGSVEEPLHYQQEGADRVEEAQAFAAGEEDAARQNGGAASSAAESGEHTLQQQQQQPEQAAPVVKGKKAREPKPQEPEQEESIHDYPVPALSFEGSPTQDSELTELEQKARQMSIHAHKLLQTRNLANAFKEQKAVVEMLVAPESAGKFRPALLVNCCLALADMTLAQRKFADTKRWLALAHAAGAHLPVKGAMVQALLNYGFVVKQEGKPVSALRAYREAVRVGEEAFGLVHSTVQKARYELVAHLVKMEREDEAMDLLVSGADQLLAKAEELEQEEKQQQDDKPATNGESKEDAAAATSSATTEQGQAAAAGPDGEGGAEEQEDEHEETREMPRSKMARHFAVRSLLNAAGVLDTKQQFEKGEELLKRAQQITVDGYGENSMAEINVLSAMAQHYKRQGRTDAAIELYEQVLGVMDEHIEVYDPDMLRERVALLNETAVLLKQVGRFEEALDYATGALVNCQTLLSVMTDGRSAAGHPMLEQFHLLLADIKQQMGDEEGAAESRRAALHGRLSFQQQRGRGGRGGARGGAAGGRSSKRTSTTAASTTRAGGRRK